MDVQSEGRQNSQRGNDLIELRGLSSTRQRGSRWGLSWLLLGAWLLTGSATYVTPPCWRPSDPERELRQHVGSSLGSPSSGLLSELDLLSERQKRWLKHGTAAVPLLVQRLDSPDLKVSEEAAKVLLYIKAPEAVEALIRYSLRLLIEPTGQLKFYWGPGVFHLTAIGKPALSAITTAYREQSARPTVRRPQEYLELLTMLAAGMTARDAEQPLLDEALGSPFPKVVSMAAVELARIRGPRAYPLLIRLLDPELAQHIRRSRYSYLSGVLYGLRIIGNPDAVERLLDLWIRYSVEPKGTPVPINFTGKWTLREGLIETIDSLTGEKMDGDLARIRAWVEHYKRRPECHQAGVR